MELPGPLLLGYTMLTLPAELGLKSLPWENWVLAGIFVGHFLTCPTLCHHANFSSPLLHAICSGLAEV